jgi:4-amino-4-deoxy-L-arabinose transferase-like glycosyltransferase
MKFQSKIFLIFILVFAFVIRIWQVGEIPTFISDEASIGYNAYSILKTGRDEWGQLMPLSFKSFGEYKLPAYIYSAVPSIGLFGLSEFATRLPSVLAGVAAVFLIFLLGRQLFSAKVGLLAAFFLTINPWHFEVSRMALEANLGLTFVLAGIYFLLKRERKGFFFSLFFFTLSFYTYNSCRLFVPIFLFLFFLIQRKTWFKFFKKNWLAVAMMLILSLPIVFSGFQGSSQRLAKVGIFSDPGIIGRIEEKRISCLENNYPLWCRIFYNRPLTYSQTFAKNYLSHFSPEYLFFEGSGLAQYSDPERGTLYLFELPLLLLGIWSLIKLRKKELLVLLSLWALTAPVANSLTGIAHPVRALVLLPVFPILTALGLTYLFSMVKKKRRKLLLGFVSGLVILISFASYLNDYFIDYPQKPGSTWQEGYRGLYAGLAKKESDFDKVVVSKFYGEPHIFYLFYQKFDPQIYQEGQEVVRYDRSDSWVNVDQIGKYYFQDKVDIQPGPLYGLTPREADEELEIFDKIAWKNGEVSFLIGKAK